MGLGSRPRRCDSKHYCDKSRALEFVSTTTHSFMTTLSQQWRWGWPYVPPRTAASQLIVFEDQQDSIGQFSFGATTVSRYLFPEHLIGYLNMITSLISSEVSFKCNGDTAVGVSVSSLDKTRKTAELCPQGELTFRGSGNAWWINSMLFSLEVVLVPRPRRQCSMSIMPRVVLWRRPNRRLS